MTAWIGPTISAVASVLGRGGEPSTPSMNIMSAAKGARRAAERYGFNPLTLLMSGAGVPGPSRDMSGQLAGAQFLGEMGAAIADSWASRVPRQDPLAQAIRRREHERLQSGALADKTVPKNFGYNLQTNTVTGPLTVAVSPFTSPTVYGPSLTSLPGGGRAWVHAPDGSLVDVPMDVLERLGVKPGGNLMASDWTDLKGEVFGELDTTVLQIPVAAHMTGSGLGGSKMRQAIPKKTPVDTDFGYTPWNAF